MDRSVEDADSTDWVVPPITVCLASCDERHTAPMRYFLGSDSDGDYSKVYLS